MLTKALLIKLTVGVILVSAIGGVSYKVVKNESIEKLRKALKENIDGGNYIAAVASFDELTQKGGVRENDEHEITRAKEFIAAEENFNRARKAALQDEWNDVRAILKDSVAVTDPKFKFYKEAQELYEEAEALVTGITHSTKVRLSELQDKAKIEKERREQEEKKRMEIEKNLKNAKENLESTKSKVDEKEKELSEKAKKLSEAESKLLEEKKRSENLVLEVEKENKEKFFNEIKIYRDMGDKVKIQIDLAIKDMEAKRDVSALLYLSQAKILADEARNKSVSFKSRTPNVYLAYINDLITALDNFSDSIRNLRNAVVYIENQNSSEFISNLQNGKNLLQAGSALLDRVSNYISAN